MTTFYLVILLLSLLNTYSQLEAALNARIFFECARIRLYLAIELGRLREMEHPWTARAFHGVPRDEPHRQVVCLLGRGLSWSFLRSS